MITRTGAIAAILWIASCGHFASAQALSWTTLKIDLQNVVEYQADIADPSQFATKAAVTPANSPKNFYAVTVIGDIVAVNGQAAKGTYVGRSRGLGLSPAATGSGTTEAIADVTRIGLREQVFEILQPDGTPIGSIMSDGFSGGSPPPGAPSTERANWSITGGTGAFLGARGLVLGAGGGGGRPASMAEDPFYRRTNGGNSYSVMVHIIPMEAPQITQTANGPAVTHLDFSPVSASKPAAAGETLCLFATGLGPTVPEVDLGLPFPSSPLANVNSPVTVTINGEAAEILGAVGYPGAVDGYQVNFQVPADAAKGVASMQVTSAWISGPPVRINIQ